VHRLRSSTNQKEMHSRSLLFKLPQHVFLVTPWICLSPVIYVPNVFAVKAGWLNVTLTNHRNTDARMAF
jgi:hypothetical protein